MVLMLNRGAPTSRSHVKITAMEKILIRKFQSIAALAMSCVLSSGCTSQQLYGAGQEYQRNQCLHMPDKAESDRCLSKMDTSYDDYRRQRDSGAK